jgi:restriction system protein
VIHYGQAEGHRSMGDYGPEDSYHYPTELLVLLQKCVPLLCPAKKDVFQFFRAAAVDRRFYSDWESRWRTDPKSVGKYPAVRDVLNRLNEDTSDDALRQRREIIKRVTAWENFSTLWPEDQLKAKGLVAEIRQSVHVTDSFTRIKHEWERELQEKREARKKELDRERETREQRESIRKEIGRLFTEPNHQKRGKALEGLLNRLFASFDILVRESFTIRGADGDGVIAQIDGAIALDNDFYLVEMKWLKAKVGPGDIAQHVMRVLHRGEGARGFFISATDYTSGAEHALQEALNYRVHFGAGLHEIILALEKQADLKQLLREKIQTAIIEKNPLSFSTKMF